MSLPPSRRPFNSHNPPRPITRGKRFSLRRKIFLFVFLCILWIYRVIDQRTKDFESDSGTPDHTEGVFTVSTGDAASSRNSYPAVFSDVYDPPHSRTIAAILPVTSSSLPHLSGSLSGLSTIPYLSEVHLLCPESIANVVRRNLRQTLSRAQGFSHTEFFVTLYRYGLSATESALKVASGILSNNTLILPQDGLAGIDSVSRSVLLSGPPSLPVPLGLRGSEVSCGTEFQGFLVARFVLPPLLLPSRSGTKNHSYLHLTSWQELGAHFAQIEGVGGVVSPATLEGVDSCHNLNASGTVTSNLEHLDSSPRSSNSNASVVILMTERVDVPAWSQLACEFESRGTEVTVIAYGIFSDSMNPTRESCKFAVTHLDPQDVTIYQPFGRSQDVFLTLAEYRLLPEPLLESTTRKTVIRIPRKDLLHCDWIASLGIQELRSERFFQTSG